MILSSWRGRGQFEDNLLNESEFESVVRHTFIQLEKGTRALLYPSTSPDGYFSISSTSYRDEYALYDCSRP
jgi:hypothetical protein